MTRALALAASLCLVLAAGARAQSVEICHATGSPNNPYVTQTVSAGDLPGHLEHDGDIVPAPDGGCPATLVQEPGGTPQADPPGSGQVAPVPTGTPIYGVPTPEATALAEPDDAVPTPAATPRPAVSPGAQGGGSPPPVTATFPTSVAGPVDGLADTGADPLLTALAGLGLLLCGLGLRDRYRRAF